MLCGRIWESKKWIPWSEHKGKWDFCLRAREELLRDYIFIFFFHFGEKMRCEEIKKTVLWYKRGMVQFQGRSIPGKWLLIQRDSLCHGVFLQNVCRRQWSLKPDVSNCLTFIYSINCQVSLNKCRCLLWIVNCSNRFFYFYARGLGFFN